MGSTTEVVNIDRPISPSPGAFFPDQIPAELLRLDHWIPWQWRWHVGRGEWAKVPLRLSRTSVHGLCADPNSLPAGDNTDPSIWWPFSTIDDYIRVIHTDAVVRPGFAMGSGCGLVPLDLDKCRDPLSGTIEPWAVDIVARMDSYTEISPSNRGLRIWTAGVKNHPRCRKGQLEIYSHGRYLTVTGNHLPGTPRHVSNCQDELDDLCLRWFGPPDGTRDDAPTTMDRSDRPDLPQYHRRANLPPPGGYQTSTLSDDEIIMCLMVDHAFAALWAGDYTLHPDKSAGDMALAGYIAFWTGPDRVRIESIFRRAAGREKWRRLDYIDRTIEAALRGRSDFLESCRGTAPSSVIVVSDALSTVQPVIPIQLPPIPIVDIAPEFLERVAAVPPTQPPQHYVISADERAYHDIMAHANDALNDQRRALTDAPRALNGCGCSDIFLHNLEDFRRGMACKVSCRCTDCPHCHAVKVLTWMEHAVRVILREWDHAEPSDPGPIRPTISTIYIMRVNNDDDSGTERARIMRRLRRVAFLRGIPDAGSLWIRLTEANGGGWCLISEIGLTDLGATAFEPAAALRFALLVLSEIPQVPRMARGTGRWTIYREPGQYARISHSPRLTQEQAQEIIRRHGPAGGSSAWIGYPQSDEERNCLTLSWLWRLPDVTTNAQAEAIYHRFNCPPRRVDFTGFLELDDIELEASIYSRHYSHGGALANVYTEYLYVDDCDRAERRSARDNRGRGDGANPRQFPAHPRAHEWCT